MNKSTVLLAVAGLCVASAGAGIRVEMTDFHDKAQRIAAAEFEKYYKLLTGRDAKGGSRVLLKIDPSMSADGYDAFSMKSDGDGLVLTGGNNRSLIYAVYDLLEQRGGCRWFWDGDKVPRITELDISNLDFTTRSRFKFRACRYFAHRGLSRFRALQWGLDEWQREIDYLMKTKVNTFMMRLGWYDLFQKAFPDICEYPDPAVRLPGTLSGYDNQSLHWSLQFRGVLRKTVMDYGFDRGLMQPEDFGTMTHWYTRTPKSFLDRMKPEFLPNSVKWYDDASALVWDIRNPKWMDMYWKLTDAAIKHYGSPEILHTMGLSERRCCDDPAENLRLKIEVMKRLIDDAQRRYPQSTIILGGWDFHFTWEPEECRQLFDALKDYRNILLWDYEADELREGGICNRSLKSAKLANWGVIGRFPYAFGIFGHATSCTDFRGEYDTLEAEWAKSKDDPKCIGYIWWGETEHCDILLYEYLKKNYWNPKYRVQAVLPILCRDRYGSEAARMQSAMAKMLPISQGHGYGHLSMNIIPFLPNVIDREKCFRVFPWRGCLNEAPGIYRELADIKWEEPMVKRDTIDIARTVTDRLLYAVLSRFRESLQAWHKGADNASDLKKYAKTALALEDAMADTLALHTDYSLWESFERLTAIENVRNPDFPQVLMENAINDYCIGYQYETAAYALRPVLEDTVKALDELLAKGDRAEKIDIRRYDYRKWMQGTPLRELRPVLPRTAENYRKTMLKLAEAAELVCPHAPSADETIHFDGMDEFFN